jgi:hypothetical protein
LDRHAYRGFRGFDLESARYRTAAPPAQGAGAAKKGSGSQQQQRPRSFLVGTQNVLEGGDYDQTLTNQLTGGSFTPWSLQATGWLAELIFYVTYTGTHGSAPTFAADGPWNIFSNVELDDVNNEAIFGPFSGYVWFLINKMGGYLYYDDPSTTPGYAFTLGTTTTFNFIMRLPLEIVNRDPLGPLASVNNTASLTLKLIQNTTATTAGPFATNFPTATAVRVRGTQRFYWEPKKTDKQGRPIQGSPPASGTTQYWTQGSVPIAAAGTINQQLITGLGYPWRQYLFLLYDNSSPPSRANGEANWPDPVLGIKFEANMLLTQVNKLVWEQEMAQSYGYPSPAFDARGGAGAAVIPGKENGVYSLNWNRDFFLRKVGGETRRSYLVTSPGSNFIFNGAIGGAGNMYSIVNYVAPGGGSSAKNNTAALTGGQ